MILSGPILIEKKENLELFLNENDKKLFSCTRDVSVLRSHFSRSKNDFSLREKTFIEWKELRQLIKILHTLLFTCGNMR